MRRIVTFCALGLSAIALMGAAPAMAQPYIYGGGYYGGPGGYGGPYGAPPPSYGPGPYGGYPPPYYGEGRYYPHRETYVGPYGHVYRRCRAHRACYNPPDY